MPTQLESPYIMLYNTTYYVVCIYTHIHNIPYIIYNTT